MATQPHLISLGWGFVLVTTLSGGANFMRFFNAIQQFNQWRQLKVKRIDGYDLDLRQFCMFVRNKEIEDVRIEEITDWLGLYKQMGFETWTIIKKSMALRKFFEYYGRQKYDVLDYWLIPIPQKTYTMPRVCTPEAFKQLMAAIPVETTAYYHIRNRCLISLIWDTGARLGEIVSLNTTDLDLENKEVVIKTEKSRGMRPFRKLPYGEVTDVTIQKWLKCRAHIALDYDLPEPDALFIGLKATGGKRLALGAAGEIFRKYSNKAKLPVVNAHSLRHHFGTELAKDGCNNSIISEALGHSSLQSSYRYTMVESSDLSRILKKRLR